MLRHKILSTLLEIKMIHFMVKVFFFFLVTSNDVYSVTSAIYGVISFKILNDVITYTPLRVHFDLRFQNMLFNVW